MIGRVGISFYSLRTALLCMSLAFTALTACGDDNPETNLCKGVTCEAGVCEKATGQCVNPTDCAGDDALCLDGFSCNASTCEADIPCDSGACERGVCAEGACINPAGCTTNANCLGDFYCGADNTCAADPCSTTTCDAGVCQIGTGECVNADICTQATEATDCVAGSKCDGGQCVTEAAFCAAENCERGVCAFDELACANADNCGGDDTKCLAGNYCADDNTCKANVCDALNQTCARGECDPASGQCVNPETCTNAANCTDAFVCVSGACVAADEACGVDGCAGNQTCTYDDGASTATCGENPAGCSSALDCTTDRICDGGACAAPAACVNDTFEPNNAAGEETDYATANTGMPVEFALCGTDTDRISFVTTDDADLTGTLIAEVKIAAADVGLGVLALDLLNENGTSVGTARTELNGTPTGSARVEFAITAINGGTYTLVVSDGGDVSTAGVRYTARMDVVDAAVVTACAAPTVLTAGTPVAGTTVNGSAALTSSCGDADGTNPEAVYSFTIDRPVYTTFVASPLAASGDFVVNIRSACERSDTELACSDSTAANRNETIGLKLDAGTYIVVVEAFSGSTGGQFALSASVEDIICTSADNTCLDVDTANVCNANGTGFDASPCDDGCEAASGACLRPTGDLCSNAFPVTATTPFNGTIARSEFSNDYDPGDASCVPNNSSSQDTDGSDTVWAVTVPDGSVVLASVTAVDFDDTTMYIVEDCADVATSCVAGVNAAGATNLTGENIFWHNDSGAEKTVFLIVDVADATSLGSPRVSISVEPFVCVPGASRCILNRESQSCNATGTGYDSTTPCDEGCDDATGQCTTSNDTCEFATVLEFARDGIAGIETSLTEIGNYTDATANCSGTSARLDAIYVLPNLQVGDSVTVDVDASFDSIISAHSGCAAGAFTTCLGDEDGALGGQNTETIQFTVATAGDYYIMVQPWSSSVTSGTFTVQATVTPPVCVPNDPAAIQCSSDLSGIESCDATGQIATFLCTGVCVPGATPSCSIANGDTCFDAKVLTANAALSGSESGNFNSPTGVASITLPTGQQGSCNVTQATPGVDTVYAFDLQPGDLLTIDNISAYDGWTKFYTFVGSCGVASACESYISGEAGPITHLAFAPERIYLVADYQSASVYNEPWSFDWEVVATNYICTPGAVTCLDPNTSSTCSADGTTEVIATCPGGGTCDSGKCELPSAGADACVGAPDIGLGGSFVMNTANFVDDVTGDLACVPGTATATGVDAFVQVTLQPYQVLEVTGVSLGGVWPYIYLFSDCADVAGSCFAGVTGSGTKTVRYQAGATVETILIGLDGDLDSATEGLQSFDVNVMDPDCLPTDPLVCNALATAINTCVQGEVVEYSCPGGCANGACTVPRGDACFDAKTLTGPTGTVAGDWAQNTNAVDVGATIAGGCVFDEFDLPDGADDIYSITLAAGETLKAQLVTTSTVAHMYIVGDCENPSTTCLVSDPLSRSQSTINYRSENGETVSIIVDRDDTATTGTYTLNYDVTNTQACAPNTTKCLDATTVEVCDANGVGSSYSCPGQCSNQACDTDAQADLCSSAVDVGTGVAILGNYADFQADLDFASACAGASEAGPDAFYSVTLAPNQILRARLLSLGDETPILYFLNSCDSDVTSCLLGSHEDAAGQAQNSVSLEYQSEFGETVIIGVDNESSFSNEPFYLSVDVLTPDCDAATYVQACNATDDGFTYCDATGFIRDYACDTTCDAASGRCADPIGDLCIDPFVATPPVLGTALVLTGTLGDFTNDYDLGTGNACTLSRTVGAEPVYVVDLLAGQTMTATVVSDATTPEDLALYVTDACTNVRTQCLGGADNEGGTAVPEQLLFTAATDGPVYLFVDSFYANSVGDFTLNVTVN